MADEAEQIAAPAVPLGHVQRRHLDAGRILAGGWFVLNYTISNRATNEEHALMGLALLPFGVLLIILSLVANQQFLGVARAAAAVADAVLFYFLAPPN